MKNIYQRISTGIAGIFLSSTMLGSVEAQVLPRTQSEDTARILMRLNAANIQREPVNRCVATALGAYDADLEERFREKMQDPIQKRTIERGRMVATLTIMFDCQNIDQTKPSRARGTLRLD